MSPVPEWRSSTVIGSYSADAIRAPEGKVEGDRYTSGSVQLVRAMLADGLVDDLHLYPLTRGGGSATVPGGCRDPRKLSPFASESYDNGVVYLAHRPQA